MGLMSKIRDRGTKVALASTIGLSLLGSGCAEMAGGFLSGMGSYEGSQVEAQAIRDAARMKQGDGGSQRSDYIDARNEFFAFSSYRGDLNNNGTDTLDFKGYGREKFEVDESIGFGWMIYNRNGATLKISLHGWGGNKLNSDERLIEGQAIADIVEKKPFNLLPGDYTVYFDVGGERIGILDFEVIDSRRLLPKEDVEKKKREVLAELKK